MRQVVTAKAAINCREKEELNPKKTAKHERRRDKNSTPNSVRLKCRWNRNDAGNRDCANIKRLQIHADFRYPLLHNSIQLCFHAGKLEWIFKCAFCCLNAEKKKVVFFARYLIFCQALLFICVWNIVVVTYRIVQWLEFFDLHIGRVCSCACVMANWANKRKIKM